MSPRRVSLARQHKLVFLLTAILVSDILGARPRLRKPSGISLLETVSRQSPLGKYFQRDKNGLNLFDYNAYGDDPIIGAKEQKILPTVDATLINPMRERQEGYAKEMQEFWTGRKSKEDCPTFPFCNHIPAPRPFLPEPVGLDVPNIHVLYPWQNKFGSNKDGRDPFVSQSIRNNRNRDRLNVGQSVSDRRERWVRPYGMFGGEDQERGLEMEHYKRHIYGNALGKLPFSNTIKYPGDLPDLSKTKESIATANHGAAAKLGVHRLAKIGPGQLADATPTISEYITPSKPGQFWDGVIPESDEAKAKRENDPESLAHQDEHNKQKKATNNINGNSAIISAFDKAGAHGGVVGSLAKSTKAMAASNTENYAGR